MALLDRELRVRDATIDALWPARFDTPLQSTVSLIDDGEWTIDDRRRARARQGLAPAPLERQCACDD